MLLEYSFPISARDKWVDPESERWKEKMDQESVLSGVRQDRSTGLPSGFGFRKDMCERFEKGLATPGDNERVERETQKRDDESKQGDAQTNSSERGSRTPDGSFLRLRRVTAPQ
jgi:hypothetical protein